MFQYWGWGGGGQTQRGQLQCWGGGGYCQKHIYACVHRHMYAHTCVKYSYTYACMHTHVCMHAQSMQTYILHPNMKIVKIKASDLYEKKNSKKDMQVNEERFGYLYCLKAI